MALFLSTFVNKVDKKGRVSVPATYRALLSSQSFQGIVAYRSFVAPCVEGCGMDFLEKLSATTEQLPVFSEDAEDFNTLIFADARQLAWDPEGRVVLPEDLMAHANITEAAAFVGLGKSFQIWEPAAAQAALEEKRRRAMANRPVLPRPAPGEGGR